MATNTIPIYSKAGQIAWSGDLKTANTAKDGTGTVETIFTAGVDGGRVERIRLRSLGTNIATVVRIFINNGLTNATPANNALYAEITVAATTVSETAALLSTNEFPSATDTTAFPIVLPPGYKLLATTGTTIAAGIKIIAIGSTY
jgi:hypothetical protein